MQYVMLPNTNLSVSRLALGGWTFAGGSRWGDVDDNESIATVRTAVSTGMNLVDTAEVYGDGHSEMVIGKALRGIRERAVIASKVHYNGGNFRYENLISACENSLQRLQTDYIDLYQLHWPGFQDETEENVARALEKLKNDGKIRHYGVCNFGVKQLTSFRQYALPVTNQVPYSIIWRAIEHGIIDTSVENDMGILTYSSLHGGILSGKYRAADEIPGPRVDSNAFANDVRKGLTVEIITLLFSLAEQHGVSVRDLALGWVLQQKGITSVLVGARTPKQAEENVKMNIDNLPAEIWQTLSSASDDLKAELGDHVDMYQNPSRIK